MVAGSSIVGAAAFGISPSFAATLDEDIAKITGGAALSEGGITLDAPEIAENGNTVPIGVDAPGAKSITLFADGNPCLQLPLLVLVL